MPPCLRTCCSLSGIRSLPCPSNSYSSYTSAEAALRGLLGTAPRRHPSRSPLLPQWITCACSGFPQPRCLLPSVTAQVTPVVTDCLPTRLEASRKQTGLTARTHSFTARITTRHRLQTRRVPGARDRAGATDRSLLRDHQSSWGCAGGSDYKGVQISSDDVKKGAMKKECLLHQNYA